MIPIYPINEETISPHYGQMVCVILHDGSRYVGQLTKSNNGQIILNGELTDSGVPPKTLDKVKHYKKRSSTSKVQKTDKVANISTLAPPPYYPDYATGHIRYGYGGAITLNLDQIALFFLVV
ncbi:hypothetical protein PASE110613_17520 [Paenibacillus sediminis]|uniref:DUF2642 domain-containing protein n=1 Tax=Paenibacillus sediminis TaxID=664909 RepID=A0ABS4H7H1_9BACL|nr:hypothetical protein [Paenibacillus sediminis]MBP1938483.1 hypothetical protein [Paenibacillus sediminis]